MTRKEDEKTVLELEGGCQTALALQAQRAERRGSAHPSTAKLRDHESFVGQVVTARARDTINARDAEKGADRFLSQYEEVRRRRLKDALRAKPIADV